jgi:hypothetical protein
MTRPKFSSDASSAVRLDVPQDSESLNTVLAKASDKFKRSDTKQKGHLNRLLTEISPCA